MKIVSDSLFKYQKLVISKELEIKKIIEIINKNNNFLVTSDNLLLKNKILFIKIKPKTKLEIILQTKRILKELKEEGVEIFKIK